MENKYKILDDGTLEFTKEAEEYILENYDGLYSLAFAEATGGMKCKSMSWDIYKKCVDKFVERIKHTLKEAKE